MENKQAMQKQDKFTEFVPFGAQDKIKLSVDMVKNLIAVKTKSGKNCTDTDAIKFISMCLARRLNPFEGDAFLIGYDSKDGPTFSLITAHQAFLKRAEVNPEYDGMKSGIIVERDNEVMDLEGDFYLPGDNLLGGWATVFFKNRKQPMHKRIRLQRFKKTFGIWVDDPAGMICKCAEADALRSSFPTMLGGLYLKEEVQDMQQPQASKPIFKQAKATEAVIEVPPAPPQAEPKADDLVKVVRDLCKRDKINENTLIEFLGAIGLADEEESLEKLHANQPSTLELCIEQWSDFSKRIKEAP